MDDNSGKNQKTPPKRGLTSLTLGWLAEKLRRSEQIKEAIDNGDYELDSSKVASAITNND